MVSILARFKIVIFHFKSLTKSLMLVNKEIFFIKKKNLGSMQNKIEKILFEVNKPSRYTGQEIGSINKNWDSTSIRTAIVFPDVYEIGISNLGHRILYHLVNGISEDFLADRVYAPAVDFKQQLEQNNLPLYGIESLKPLNEFDVVGFSLQYELGYPTILAMMDLGRIPVRNIDRQENDPIVIAGGPGVFNPEPLTDFIDAFLIGDGEDLIVEVLQSIKKAKSAKISREEILKNLQKIDGVYVPKFYEMKSDFSTPVPISNEFPAKINKRIANLDNADYPRDFPLPYLLSVHDRAVIEIRRGCARMCRFCQPSFVNFPVRERTPEQIVDLTKDILKNTGYDEYSLLSLSSSDYKGIENLVCVLNNEHSKTRASLSLPSQRADAFSVELAEMVQAVRKSTLTFAPEAGSQRLRDVINKNLTEEQILDAIFSAYKAGWSAVKLYFMIGLPTETFDDLDAIYELMKTIKDKARSLKIELNLNKHLDLTATVSNYVPKPFTPFQWCPQDNVELLNEKNRYLKDKVKSIKGVKLNYNDSFVSQIEAVFSKGDRNLNSYLELVYKKGAYLDAWEENFSRSLWRDAAAEVGIELDSYSCREISPEVELPWDLINVGVEKDWLKEEYKKALEYKTSSPCDEGCSVCGVCQNFNTEPAIKSKDSLLEMRKNIVESLKEEILSEVFKYRLKIQKAGTLKYISHLDWQRLLYRAVRKVELNVDFTKGFNPSPKISLGMALPLFVESKCEYVDIELKEEMDSDVLMTKLNSVLPESSKIGKIIKISKSEKSIDASLSWAKYIAKPIDCEQPSGINLNSRIQTILSEESIFIVKEKYKGSSKTIDIRPLINSLAVVDEVFGTIELVLQAGQVGNLRPDEFLKYMTPDIKWSITRESLLDCNFKELV